MNSIIESRVNINEKSINVFNRGSQDIGILEQTFTHKQFLFPPRHEGLFKRYSEIVQTGKTPLIIDAGANIGTATIWFAETFANSHIVSIEPDISNFQILKSNCVGYNVDLRNGGISNKTGRGSIIDPGRGPLGLMTKDGDDFEYWTGEKILLEKVSLGMEPFIFKCDIEGGESKLFSENIDWIDYFDLLIIEPHDWMLPGSASSQNVLKAISKFPRDFYFWGECIFSYKNATTL
ncbi:MAG: FkbM family methyltransferase [Gammaproteobacteria bacterium]|nr:FkbM family methyltransferase [Gammaproteobacteria bacterium]